MWGTRKLDEVFQYNLAVQMKNQWQAVVHASGLGMSFRKWIASHGFPYFPGDFTDRIWISKAHEAVLSEAQSLSKQAWSQKQAKMKERLQNSFSENGGKDAFQRIKKESLPDISVLYRKVKLDLEPP